jgi:hypothetical protein
LQFCRRTSSSNTFKQCYFRARSAERCTSGGFGAEWNEKKCVTGMSCSLESFYNPVLGGTCKPNDLCGSCDSLTFSTPVCASGKEYPNACEAKCYGIDTYTDGPCNVSGCSTDDNCTSTSFFCKRAMINSNFKSCFMRSSEGQPCTTSGYFAAWDERKCFGLLECVLNDMNAPGNGGTCRSHQSSCNVDTDCSSNVEFCKRASATNNYKACFARAVPGETCTIGTSVPEWNVKRCVSSLHCTPYNTNNPSTGGECTELASDDADYWNFPDNNMNQYNNNQQYSNGYNQQYNNGYNQQQYYNGYNNGYNGYNQQQYSYNGYGINAAYNQPQYSYNGNNQPQYNYNNYNQPQYNYNSYNQYQKPAWNQATTSFSGSTAAGSSAGSCRNHCNGHSGSSCFCDSKCVRAGDCCSDVKQYCAVG